MHRESEKEEFHCDCCINKTAVSRLSRITDLAWIIVTILVFMLIAYFAFYFLITSESKAEGFNTISYPISTELAIRNADTDLALVDERGLKSFILGLGFEDVSFGVSFAALVAACALATGATFGAAGVLCISGAIASGLTFIGLDRKYFRRPNLSYDESGGGYYHEFRASLGRHGLHRGYVKAKSHAEIEADREADEEYLRLFGSSRRHIGWITANSTIHGHLVPPGYEAWPTYEFNDINGNRVHHVIVDNGNSHRVRLWYPDSNVEDQLSGNNDISKDLKPRGKGHKDKFGHQHFKHGGIDINVCERIHGKALTKEDYKSMDKKVHCYIKGKLKHRALKAKIKIGEDLEGTASMAPVNKKGRSAIDNLPYCNFNDVPVRNKCSKK